MLNASKEVGLEVKAQKATYMFMTEDGMQDSTTTYRQTINAFRMREVKIQVFGKGTNKPELTA